MNVNSRDKKVKQTGVNPLAGKDASFYLTRNANA